MEFNQNSYKTAEEIKDVLVHLRLVHFRVEEALVNKKKMTKQEKKNLNYTKQCVVQSMTRLEEHLAFFPTLLKKADDEVDSFEEFTL